MGLGESIRLALEGLKANKMRAILTMLGIIIGIAAVIGILTVGDGLLGDVNGDGKVDQADAQMILDFEAKRIDRELSLKTADVSGDGVIDSNDAVLILQYAAGTLKEFPAAAPKETEDKE